MVYLHNGVRLEIEEDHVSISTLGRDPEAAEIVYWNESEWREDPSVAVSMANAVAIALTDGARALAAKIGKTIDAHGAVHTIKVRV